MKILMALFLLSGFCFKSSGIVFYKQDKAHNPGGKIVQSFHIPSEAYKKEHYAILEKPGDYPWGVCFPKGKHNFEQKHLNWTWQAMEEWNEEYDAFVQSYEYDTLVSNPLDFPFPGSHLYHSVDNRSYFVRGWPNPKRKLLTWSCDKDKYNLVYPLFGSTKDTVLAYYRSINPPDWYRDLFVGVNSTLISGPGDLPWDFFGQIVMSNKHKWEREHFINVMMHEFGHLLGIPHLEPDETEIMASQGFGCKDGGYGEICAFTKKDFNAFLDNFSNGGQVVRNWPFFRKFKESQEYYKGVIEIHEREKDIDLAMKRTLHILDYYDNVDIWIEAVEREFAKIRRNKPLSKEEVK